MKSLPDRAAEACRISELPDEARITFGQVATLLGVCDRTVRRYVRAGRLPVTPLGGVSMRAIRELLS
jgi:excisionase family DNA binding protein